MTGTATPTLVVSDLHLGSGSGADVLRAPGVARDRLLAALDGVERLVVAGDLLELRHAPPREILDRARPALRALGERLGPDRQVLLLAGNHDHRLVRPWLDHQRMLDRPLAVTNELAPADVSEIAVAVAEALAPAEVRIAYPAAWLVTPSAASGGVLVSHGHYMDALWRIPTVERLAAGLVARIHGSGTEDLRDPDGFERLLGPAYGWMDGLADHAVGHGVSASQRTSAGIWEHLNDRSSWRGRMLRTGLPRAIRLLGRAGIGEFEGQLTPEALRIAGTRAIASVAGRLDVHPDHLIVGHSHRAGPQPGDAAWEWRLDDGGHLHNSGCWVHDGTLLSGSDPTASPYWPGRAIRIDADGVPRLLGLLDDVRDPFAAA